MPEILNGKIVSNSADVTGVDSTSNITCCDVAGNKNDTVDGNSLYSLSKLATSNHITKGAARNGSTAQRIQLGTDDSDQDGAYDPAGAW